MSTNEALTGIQASKRLTWAEICARYPDEWVSVVDVVWVSDIKRPFRTAIVLGHHKQRKAASPKIKAAFEQHEEVGCFWTGKIRGPIPRFIP